MRPLDTLNPLNPAEPASRLDRIWEATRSDDPSPQTLDALWAQALVELDRIEATRSNPSSQTDRVLKIRGGHSRRHRALVGVLLAQAALILLAVGFVFSSREGKRVEVSQSDQRGSGSIAGPVTPVAPRPGKTVNPVIAEAPKMMVVDFDKTAIVRIEPDGHRLDVIDEPSVFPTIAAVTAHEVFNALETMGTPGG